MVRVGPALLRTFQQFLGNGSTPVLLVGANQLGLRCFSLVGLAGNQRRNHALRYGLSRAFSVNKTGFQCLSHVCRIAETLFPVWMQRSRNQILKRRLHRMAMWHRPLGPAS